MMESTRTEVFAEIRNRKDQFWLTESNLFSIMLFSAPVAQLDRACGYEPQGREFESLRARQTLN